MRLEHVLLPGQVSRRPRTLRPHAPLGGPGAHRRGTVGSAWTLSQCPRAGHPVPLGKEVLSGCLPHRSLSPVSWADLASLPRGLIHLLTHLAEALHQARLLIILVIPPAVTPG